MKVSELTGAHLDYHVARAEGMPAAELEIRPVQRPDPGTPDSICVRKIGTLALQRMDYSTNGATCMTLLIKHGLSIIKDHNGWWSQNGRNVMYYHPDSPMIAICRAVVRAAFGDEVEDLP